VEEIGIFLICAVVGFTALRQSFFLKNKLHGSFDEVLPYILGLGFVVLSAAYIASPLIPWGIGFLPQWLGKIFQCPTDGLMANVSWRDIDAIWIAWIFARSFAWIIDSCARVHFVFTTRFFKWGQVNEAFKEHLLRRIIEDEGDDFQKLQLVATTTERKLLVTLTNDRLYYGIPRFEARHPKRLLHHNAYRQLRLLPLLSGYRDRVTKKVCLTDAHPPSSRNTKIASHESLLEVPYDKIVSFQYVDVKFLMANVKISDDLKSYFKEQAAKKKLKRS
jgi:hypothetical protein